MNMTRLVLLLVSLTTVWSSCQNIRLNELQVKATHNSYHVAPALAFPDVAYSRANLTYQLQNQGIRGLELDFEYSSGAFTVAHNPLDPLTNCPDLSTCLGLVKAWLATQLPNPPVVFVWIESKDVSELTTQQWNEFDAVLISTFGSGGIFSPDDLRQSSATVQAQVFAHGWPSLASVSGQVIFILDLPYPNYIQSNLAGRVAFPSYPDISANDTNAVFLKILDGVGEAVEIRNFVSAGYMVRTFADYAVWPSNTLQLSEGNIDYLYFNAIAGGASSLSYTAFVQWAYSVGFTGDQIDGLIQACVNRTSYDVSTFSCFVRVEQSLGLVMTAVEYYTQAQAATRRDTTLATGAQLIYTDYPSPGVLSSYYVSLGTVSQPFSCNPILTSAQNCSAATANDFTPFVICPSSSAVAPSSSPFSSSGGTSSSAAAVSSSAVAVSSSAGSSDDQSPAHVLTVTYACFIYGAVAIWLLALF